MKLFNPIQNRGFKGLQFKLDNQFIGHGHEVQPNRWQGVSIAGKPEAKMYELLNVHLMVDMVNYQSTHWVEDLGPNMPWAEDHFQERVCGYPINPGVEWKNWPWGDNAEKFLDAKGQFNHNYMERYWPIYAPQSPAELPSDWTIPPGYYEDPNVGIRGVYGDLHSLVQLLLKEPDTRQAYFPVWFPEDTGIGDGGRKPCSLGYLFMIRDQKMHIQYFIRSCDYFRHMADDIYLTIRLGEWIIEQAAAQDPWWGAVKISSFFMGIGSLHMFVNDMIKVRERI